MAKKKVAISKAEREFIEEYAAGDTPKERMLKAFLVDLKTHIITSIPEETSERKQVLTGCLPLDVQTGGLLPGVTQLYGPPDSMKSSLAVHIAAASRVSPFYVNADNKPFRWAIPSDVQFPIAEGSYDTSRLVKDIVTEEISEFIIIDTITALNRGLNTLKTVVKHLSAHPNLILLVINQTRDSRYTKSSEPAGGDQLHGLCTTMIAIRSIESTVFGTRIYCEIEKPRKISGRFYIPFSHEGTPSNEMYVVDTLIQKDVIVRSGAFFTMDGKRYRMSELVSVSQNVKKIWKKYLEIHNSIPSLIPEEDLTYERYMGRTISNTS